MPSFEGTKLRVCASYLRQKRNQKDLRNSRLILLEHILPTTEEYLLLLRNAGAEIYKVIGKPYSVDSEVLKRLQNNSFPVEIKQYDFLESSTYLDELLDKAVEKSRKDKKKILILEVGGYFALPLSRRGKKDQDMFAGVVEDTTFGHNRYLSTVKDIHIPVISVARSRLKEIEAHFVGGDAVQAVDHVLRGQGLSLTGRQAVVIGYGMIGKNVARALKAHDLNVSVYDIRDHRNLKAFMMGFNVDKKSNLLRRADVVFCATGWESSLAITNKETGKSERRMALSSNEIHDILKDNAVLASVGSKNNEIDMKSLEELAITSPKMFGEYICKYKLPNDDNVFVINEGTAVNFLLPSIPIEILDLVFSEILLAGLFLLKKRDSYAPGRLYNVNEKYWSFIAKDWLRFTNPKR